MPDQLLAISFVLIRCFNFDGQPSNNYPTDFKKLAAKSFHDKRMNNMPNCLYSETRYVISLVECSTMSRKKTVLIFARGIFLKNPFFISFAAVDKILIVPLCGWCSKLMFVYNFTQMFLN